MLQQFSQAQGLDGGLPQLQQGIAPGEFQGVIGGDQIVDGHGADVLLQMAGERNLLIFRSNPQAQQRPESLRLFVNAHETVEDILLQVRNHWPDLGMIDWELMSVNEKVASSLELQQGDVCLLVWTPQDLFGWGSGIVLIENQVWNIGRGTVETALHPATIWKQTSLHDFFALTGYGRYCDISPCTILQDGELALYGEALQLYDADYVVIMQIEDVENSRMVIYDPTIEELPVLQRIPTDFEDQVRQTSILRGMIRAEDYALEAWKFSWTMTSNARRIFSRRNMLATQGRDLYVFPCLHGPAKFHVVKHSAFRDPFGLLLTLKEKNLVDENIQWKLMGMHPSVMTTGLALHGLVIGVLEEGDRDPATEVFVLYEKTLRPRRSPQEAYRNYVSLWTDKLYERQTFLRQQGMFAVCQIHECTSYVNGDVVQPGEQMDLLDGSFSTAGNSSEYGPKGSPRDGS